MAAISGESFIIHDLELEQLGLELKQQRVIRVETEVQTEILATTYVSPVVGGFAVLAN